MRQNKGLSPGRLVMGGTLGTMGRQGSAGQVWCTRLGCSNPQSAPVHGTASCPVLQRPRGQVRSETGTAKPPPGWRQGCSCDFSESWMRLSLPQCSIGRRGASVKRHRAAHSPASSPTSKKSAKVGIEVMKIYHGSSCSICFTGW